MVSVLLLIPLLALADNNKTFDLTIVHTNDIHAHLLSFDKQNNDCSQKKDTQGKCFGGIARRMTAIENIRKTNKNLLLLDAGDQLQGTMFYVKYRGDESRYFLNALGFNAITLGNHEFDDGPKNLARFISGLKLPVVSANIDVSKEPLLTGAIKPYTTIDIGGQKIGIIGCTTPETATLSNPGANIKFTNIETAVVDAIDELEKQGIDKIILLCHEGYEADKSLARKINGIDVIVGGHSHTYLSNNLPSKDIDKAAGPYPTVVKSPKGNPVLIVQDYAYGKYLGRLTVTFNQNGIPIKWSGNPILLNAKIKPDAKIASEVQKFNLPLEKMRKEIIGRTKVDLHANCRLGECNFGDLITDAMLNATTTKKAEVAILNSGTIRSGIIAGNISFAAVLNALPLSNTLITFGLKGKDLRAALENGLSRGLQGAGRFPQIAGLRIKWSPFLPAGYRIISIDIKQKDKYLPLEPYTIYQITTTNYISQGGDGYTILPRKAINPYDCGISLSDAVIDFIRKKSPINPEIENRITMVR